MGVGKIIVDEGDRKDRNRWATEVGKTIVGMQQRLVGFVSSSYSIQLQAYHVSTSFAGASGLKYETGSGGLVQLWARIERGRVMSHWNGYEVRDIFGDEDGGVNHFLPFQDEHALESVTLSDSRKKPRYEALSDVKSSIDREGTANVPSLPGKDGRLLPSALKEGSSNIPELSRSLISEKKAQALGFTKCSTGNTLLDCQGAEISVSSFGEGKNGTENTTLCSDYPFPWKNGSIHHKKAGDISSANVSVPTKERREGENDPQFYDCPNIEDFEDFDRMFRNLGSTFVQGSTVSEDDISWFSSSSHGFHGMKDTLQSVVLSSVSSVSEFSAFKNTSSHGLCVDILPGIEPSAINTETPSDTRCSSFPMYSDAERKGKSALSELEYVHAGIGEKGSTLEHLGYGNACRYPDMFTIIFTVPPLHAACNLHAAAAQATGHVTVFSSSHDAAAFSLHAAAWPASTFNETTVPPCVQLARVKNENGKNLRPIVGKFFSHECLETNMTLKDLCATTRKKINPTLGSEQSSLNGCSLIQNVQVQELLSSVVSAPQPCSLQAISKQNVFSESYSSNCLHSYNPQAQMSDILKLQHVLPGQTTLTSSVLPGYVFSNDPSRHAPQSIGILPGTFSMPSMPIEKNEKIYACQKFAAPLVLNKPSEQHAAASESSAQRKYKFDVEVDGDKKPAYISGNLPAVDIDSSTFLNNSCMTSTFPDDVSLKAANFQQLQMIIDRLGVRTKLCVRDSLYRLARSAEKSHYYGTAKDVSIGSSSMIGLQGGKDSKRLIYLEDESKEGGCVGRQVEQIKSWMEEKFSTIEGKFSTMEERLSSIENRSKNLEDMMKKMIEMQSKASLVIPRAEPKGNEILEEMMKMLIEMRSKTPLMVLIANPNQDLIGIMLAESKRKEIGQEEFDKESSFHQEPPPRNLMRVDEDLNAESVSGERDLYDDSKSTEVNSSTRLQKGQLQKHACQTTMKVLLAPVYPQFALGWLLTMVRRLQPPEIFGVSISTNAIERSVAYLLFHKSLESGAGTADINTCFKPPMQIHGPVGNCKEPYLPAS
ncbi:hypothetical protein M5K25_018426 [Dendrobium thyrsiflorum]|uniref:Uncharacterized protein n=1 Tax=Dendrobium thyrsiflorum TaxID=117978 RepID=A0ABD0UI82_DENTH